MRCVMSDWKSAEASDVRVGDLISWSLNKPKGDFGCHCGTVLKIDQGDFGERVFVTLNDKIHVHDLDSQLWRKELLIATLIDAKVEIEWRKSRGKQ